MGDGYDVYVVTDASGGVSVEAHERAIQRLRDPPPAKSWMHSDATLRPARMLKRASVQRMGVEQVELLLNCG